MKKPKTALRESASLFLYILCAVVVLTVLKFSRNKSFTSNIRYTKAKAAPALTKKGLVLGYGPRFGLKNLLQINDFPLRKAVGSTDSNNTSKKRESAPILSNQLVKEKPIILVWTTSKQFRRKPHLLQFNTSEDCGSCRITINRLTFNKSIAVVLFNTNEPIQKLDIPNPAHRNSKPYVFWTRETPSKTQSFRKKLLNPEFDSIFNLTMAYTRNADIRRYFGTFHGALEASNLKHFTGGLESDLLKIKSKLAVWFVSNCYHLSGATDRMKYAKGLVKAGLRLDKFGSCFQARNETKITFLVAPYKFYLAFENSLHCPDYITEKFWRNSLESGLVPVVWGPTKQHVLDVAPPNSFIHTDDFGSPEDLVKYLNYLDNNDKAYMAYHKWRDIPLSNVPAEPFVEKRHFSEFCRLCRRLIIEQHPPKSIPSISKWLYESEYPDDKCLRPFANLTEKEQKYLLDF
ncbi:unnamed protein product [Clavelina lepadiformis]|uniref:Fucosyltransferase n=1 Tax=Clavelina lepadiformis TaxID=159417 RepID=A0ABP0G0V5_CLALP